MLYVGLDKHLALFLDYVAQYWANNSSCAPTWASSLESDSELQSADLDSIDSSCKSSHIDGARQRVFLHPISP